MTSVRPTVLPHALAVIYSLAIAYASLQPFGPWMAPPRGTAFFVLAPSLPRFTRFDILANVLAYVPLGFFLSLVRRDQLPWGRFAGALAGGALLSFLLESLQMLLPSRDASIMDVLSNTVGAAFGGAFGVMFANAPRARGAVRRARHRWLLDGTFGDIGLTLLVVWLVVQVNPAIPLFATMFDPAGALPQVAAHPPNADPDVAALLIEAAHSAFQILGVGLFLALLLRDRRVVGVAVLALLAAAIVVKTFAAALLLTPVALQQWLRPGVMAGVAMGTLLLMIAVWLPRPVQVAVATVALLSSLLATLLTPELLWSRAPVAMFNWSYGQLLNFNGLTHAVLLLWPLVACGFLFVLAGRPRWGAPG
ncbi:MAG: VanZ family protein [Casimicrobiaceae bacterium]